MRYIARGLLWGIAGTALGLVLLGGIRVALGYAPLTTEPAVALSYPLGLAGWLLGIGLWDTWAREWVGLKPKTLETSGWRRYFGFTVDHKVIGIQYLVTFVLVFLLAGLLAMLMRLELAAPGENVLTTATYNQVMSLHGIMMIAVAVVSILGSFGNYLVPLMIGAEDMAFPRLNALSYWLVPPSVLLLLISPLFGGWDSGWTAYPPLSEVNKPGQVLFILAFITLGLSSILGGVNFLTTIAKLRAPGMTWGRLPIFVWSVFAASILSLLFTQAVAAALLMVTLDRIAGTAFFNPDRGGLPILYQHVFWFYSHPAVYIMIIPGWGIALEVLSHLSRKPLFAYPWAVAGFLGVTLLSGVVWAHHMFTSGMPQTLHGPFLATTELISVPTGLVFLSGLGTIWLGRLWLRTPMLFALAVLFNFLIGGITGIFLADVPTDLQLQDTYFVVAHFHYTIVGGEIFALFAGIYYWFPKLTGRMFSEWLGKLHFWIMFFGFQLTFLPMFWLGLHGMNRRVADYLPNLAGVNLWVSLMAFLLGSSFLIFVINMVRSAVKGMETGPNPWKARTLEWQTSSPPPVHNFPRIPNVVGSPYDYGVPGAVHAIVMAGASGSEPEEG